MSAWDIIYTYRLDFLKGLEVTMRLCLIVWLIGIVAGTIIGIAGARWKTLVGLPSRFLSFLLSGVPVLVFLFWLYYPLQYALNVDISPFKTAVAALSIVNTFLVADLIRGVLLEFPDQYLSAARVCGLTGGETVVRIQLPIIARQVIPNLLFIQVGMLQATLFASLISVNEIFRIAQRVNSEVYRPIPIYTALAFFFLAICLPLHGLASYLKKKYTRNLSES